MTDPRETADASQAQHQDAVRTLLAKTDFPTGTGPDYGTDADYAHAEDGADLAELYGQTP